MVDSATLTVARAPVRLHSYAVPIGRLLNRTSGHLDKDEHIEESGNPPLILNGLREVAIPFTFKLPEVVLPPPFQLDGNPSASIFYQLKVGSA